MIFVIIYIKSQDLKSNIFRIFLDFLIKIYYFCKMNKKSEEKKKRKISFSVNEKLLSKLDEHLENEDLGKRSKYIEKLIREDMKKRGKDVTKEF